MAEFPSGAGIVVTVGATLDEEAMERVAHEIEVRVTNAVRAGLVNALHALEARQ